jgi:histidinol-phosphatase
MREVTDDLALALELADLADERLLAGFGDPRGVETKADGTPVSAVDRETEAALRAALAERRPDDAVLGEEGGGDAEAARRWVLDPLDGTKNYLRRSPVFACLIGLETNGRVEVGVASAPALGRRWWAARGYGAFANGEPIRVSEIDTLERAELLHSGLGAWQEHGRWDAFVALQQATKRCRGYGDFWPYCLVAEGVGELAVEPGGLKRWDVAALEAIVLEAGGEITALDGSPVNDDGSLLASNGRVHAAAVSVLAG